MSPKADNYVIINNEPHVHVTHVIQTLHKWGLIDGAVNVAVDFLAGNIDEQNIHNLEIWKESRTKYKEDWDGKAEIGQIVHALNASFLRKEKGMPLPPVDEITNPYYAFTKFCESYDVRPLAIEESVHHTIKRNGITLRCAGRLDLLADIKAPGWRRHRRYVLDYKISPRIYPEDIIQVAVYRWFYMKMTGTYIDGAANLRLDRDKIKYQFKPYTKARLRWAYSRFIDLLSYWIKTNERRP